MEYREPDEDIGCEMTLMDMWYFVSMDFLRYGVISKGGQLTMDLHDAANIMANELFKTTERYRLHGRTRFPNTPYTELYSRFQTDIIPEDILIEWRETVWCEIMDGIVDVEANLKNPDISWMPCPQEMYNIHENVLLGLIWAIIYIPIKNEDDNDGYSEDERFEPSY